MNDGIIHGHIIHPRNHKTKLRCDVDNCPDLNGRSTTAIEVIDAKLPDGIDKERTILKGVGIIGIACGCYARFHRQIAHIQDNMKGRE